MSGTLTPKSAAFKNVGGQPSFVARKPVPYGGTLPSLQGGAGPSTSAYPAGSLVAGQSTGLGGGSSLLGPGASGAQFSVSVSSAKPVAPAASGFKQRGILSEVVRMHSPEEIRACNMGPVQQQKHHESATLRKPVGAQGFKLSQHMRAKAEQALPREPKPQVAEVPPKVVEVYNHRPGDRPRKVTVERRQKWYASLDIEELLLQRRITFRSPEWDAEHWLTLDDFDNTEYDIRGPQEWLEQGVQEDGTRLPVRATGLRTDPDGGGVWQECVVTGLDENNNFLVA